MALKDEDFLLKNDKDLEEAMARLGLVLEEDDKPEVEDPMDRFGEFDMSALHASKDEAKDGRNK